jgi:predicted N-acetyltransferase YhbS
MGEVTRPRPLQGDDDREKFDCGQSALNDWFRRHAWRNHRIGDSRINIVCDVETDRIIGYVALCASQVERSRLPKAQQRNRPNGVPMILLGQLAVDLTAQGQGLAIALMKFTFKSALEAAQIIGCVGIVTQPINNDVRIFYEKFGFADLPQDAKGAMLLRLCDIKISA